MLLPLTCLKRNFLKVLQSLRGYIDTILPKSLGHIATLAYRQACPEAVVHDLHHINFKMFFHPAKFDNLKDETISDYKTVSVPQSQILAGLKSDGLAGL